MSYEESPLLTYASSTSSLFPEKENAGHKKVEWTASLRENAEINREFKQAAFLLRDAIRLTSSSSAFASIYQDDVLEDPIDALSSKSFKSTNSSYSFDTEASNGSKVSVSKPLRSRIRHWSRRILKHQWTKFVVYGSIVCLVFISFLEPPSWCRTFTVEGDGRDSSNSSNIFSGNGSGCKAAFDMRGPPAFYVEDDEPNSSSPNAYEYYYPSSGVMILSVGQSLLLEGICVGLILLHTLICISLDGFSPSYYFSTRTHHEDDSETGDDDDDHVKRDMNNLNSKHLFMARTIRVIRLVATILLIEEMLISSSRPLTIFLRIILFISFSEGTQRELITGYKMIPQLSSILFILFVVVVFYAWIGIILFFESTEWTDFFSTLVEAMWTLWICVTTANYPDVMMPAYDKSRLAAIYFVSFMVITFFFLMNVILASVVNTYRTETDVREQDISIISKAYIQKAFRLLDKSRLGYVNRDQIMTIFLILNEDCDDIRSISQDTAELLFAILDQDGSGRIDMKEFTNFGTVLLLKFEPFTPETSLVEHHFPKFFSSHYFEKFSNFILSNTFEITIDVILILNAIVVAIQSYPELAGEEDVIGNPLYLDGTIDTKWEVLETIFTIVYCMEMFSKLLVLGWKRYLKSLRNVFDGSITILSLAATLYVYYPNSFTDSRLIRYTVMARVLRLLRLLVAIKEFRMVSNTLVQIVPAGRRIMILLFCIMYIYSAIGMHFFGGTITRDPANPLSMKLEGTDFAENYYFANNFNDMFSGMNVLFNLLVINNWPEMSDGLQAVTDSKYSRFFFLSFHIIAVVMVNNVVIAFIIDSFMDEWTTPEDEIPGNEDKGDAIVRGHKALFEANEITGTKTHLSGTYYASLLIKHQPRSRKRSILNRLFTKGESNFSSGGTSHISDPS